MEDSQKSSVSLISLFQEINDVKKELEETKKVLQNKEMLLKETQKKLEISEKQTIMFKNKCKRVKREHDIYR
jgi:hypothetical protein